MRRRRPFLVGVGVLCLVCLATACSKDNASPERVQRVAKLQAAYDAVAAVETATKAGLTYEAYEKMLPTASSALMAYQAPDAESRAIAGHLSAAVYSYQNALRAWATKYDECQDCAWRKFVSAHPQFALEDADPDYAVTILWNTAAGEMASAREKLTTYKTQ